MIDLEPTAATVTMEGTLDMGIDETKTVFRVSDKARLKSNSASTETG